MKDTKNIAYAVSANAESMDKEYEQAWKWAVWMRDSLKMMSSIYLGDFHGPKPHVEFYQDETQFFNPQLWEIHLGTKGIVDLFHPQTREEFVEAVNYVYGHEEQHLRSTTDSDYAWGIQRGCEVILEHMASKIETSKKRFRSEADYKVYANKVLPAKGIYVNWALVQQLVAGIANSLEDGRIERIRPKKFPGFLACRKMFRALFWQGMGADYHEWTTIKENPTEQLRIICNQILSLSTCQLYQPGFKEMFESTPIMKTVDMLAPHIANAVASASCKGMSKECVQICRILAPLIYDACRISANDAARKKMLEDIVRTLILAGISSSHKNGRSKSSEEISQDDYASLFEHSDLEVTLPDEVCDKLVEDAQETGKEGGITIRREHPKEGTQGKPDKTMNPNQDHPSADMGQTGQSQTGSNALDNAGTTDGHKDKSSGRVKAESAMDAVLQEAQQAAAKARDNTLDAIEATNQINKAKKPKESGKVKGNKGQAISANDQTMKDLCPNFQELRRYYALKEQLPVVLKQRGKVLHRKNERYLKTISTPTRTRLESGSIDPGLITGLAYGNGEVFRKKGKDRKFNGCVYILVDNSGSMRGVKRKSACASAAVIEEGFRNLMPVKIVAFDEGSYIIHDVVKDWEETSKLNMSWNFYMHGREGGGNEDGYDIMIATRELLSRPEDKKLLIVLSDGAPGDQGLVRKAVEDARKKGIKVCGIYFEEGEVESDDPDFVSMYQRDYICCCHREIDRHLEKIVRKFSRN